MAIGNTFMDMISKGISNTKPEGVMTARNERIMQLDSLVDPDMDVGDLRTIYDEMMLNSGGKYPGGTFDDFLKLIGTRTASNDEAVRQLEILFEMFKDQGMSDEEAEKAARERMENAPELLAKADKSILQRLKELMVGKPYTLQDRVLDDGTKQIITMEPGIFSDTATIEKIQKKADGGIMHLAPGGSVRTPSTYEAKTFEEYLAELGPEFRKKDPDTGLMRGAKGKWNEFVLSKGIKPGSPEATKLLNDMRKARGLSPYISTSMALKGYGQDVAEIATGTKTGQVGAADRDAFYKKSKSVFKEADKMEFKNKNDKYKFIEKQLVKAYPTLAGTSALATFISKRALGAASVLTPSDLEAATIYSPEEMEKFFSERKIKEKFQ